MTDTTLVDLFEDELDFSLQTSSGVDQSGFLSEPVNGYYSTGVNNPQLRMGLDLPTSTYSAYYAHPYSTLGTSQPPPLSVHPPAIYVHQGSTSPEQIVYATPSPMEAYVPLDHVKETDRSTDTKTSVPIVTLNPNNFIGNPTRIPYLAETTRKRPLNVQIPENELDSVNAKRVKNREAARRWRQGKKDQIADLQGEVHLLKTKIDAMQTEMETLRIENQYLKQELTKSRQDKVPQPPPQSPNLLSLTSQTFRPPTHEINFLPNPSSLFLLCLFVFSLCLSLPTSPQRYPGTNLVMDLSSSTTTRVPRLLDQQQNKNPTANGVLKRMEETKTTNWFISWMSQVIERLIPQTQFHLLETSVLKVPSMAEMNKRLTIRLDRFL